MKSWLFLACLLGMSALAEAHAEQLATQDLSGHRMLAKSELLVTPETTSYVITLPSGEQMSFTQVEVKTNAGVRTIRGKTANAKLLLTTDGTNAFGFVFKDRKKYVINTVGHAPTIVESGLLQRPEFVPQGWGDDFVVNHDLIFERDQRQAVKGGILAKTQTPSVVDIAFFYDQLLVDLFGLQNPRTRVQSAIEYTNDAIAAHNVELELRAVFVGPLSQPLSGDPFNHFLANSDKWAVADDYGADLLHYIYRYSGQVYCGKAQLPGRVGVTGCGTETVAHEIGHNLGLHHDRANASHLGLPYSDYNYGYICGNSGTIMAYWSPTVPHFSSPQLQNGGENCGVEIGLPDAAFNGAVFDVTRADTEDFNAPPPPAGAVWIDTAGPILINETDASTEVLVTVVRDGDLDQATSVEVGTFDISATRGRDYTELIERIEFAPGEATKQFTITVIDDANYEPTTEEFEIVLRYPFKLTVTGSPLLVQIASEDLDRGIVGFTTDRITIDESHGTLQIEIERTGSTLLEHTVDFTIEPTTAVAGVDYTDVSGPMTFGVGETLKTVSIPIIDDDIFDGGTYVHFWGYLSNGDVDPSREYLSVQIDNDDLYPGVGQFVSDSYYVDENAGTVSIEVERVNGDEGRYPFCVGFAYDGTAINNVDYAGGVFVCTSFANGQTSKIITRPIYDNAEADGEKFFDIEFESQNENGVIVCPCDTARVFILDDEPPAGPTGSIEFGAPTIVGDEGDGMISVPVSRVGGSFGGAVVDYSTSQGSATSGSDYTDVSGSVFWFNGDSDDKFIQIPVINDDVEESAESLQLTLSGVSGATAGSRMTATVTIAESDQPVGPATEFDLTEFLDRADGVTLIDFEGYVEFDNYIYLGSPGSFTESGVTITNNSQMFLQNNNFYNNDSFLSPQGVDPQIVNISLPSGTKAVAFFYGAYSPVSGTVTIDGGQQFTLPEVQVGFMGLFAIAREVPIESVEITVNGPSIDLDNIMFASTFDLPEPPFLVPYPEQYADITTFADVTGDQVPDIAGFVDQGTGIPTVTVYSGASGGEQATRSYLNDKWVGIGLATVRDANQDGANNDPAVAVLAVNKTTKKIRVQTKRADNGGNVSSIQFLNENWTALDAVVVDDLNGDGITNDSAIAVLARRKSDGRIQLQLRDLLSGALIANTVYLNSRWTAIAAAVADRSAMSPAGTLPPLIGVIAENPANGKRIMQSRVAGSGTFERNVKFLGSTWDYNDVSVNHDANGDGTRDDPVWQVLATRFPDAAVWVQARSVADGSFVDNMAVLNSNWEVFRLDSAEDMGGAATGELSVSAMRRIDQTRRINITDSGTGATTKNIAP